jgi:hypothetical protein
LPFDGGPLAGGEHPDDERSCKELAHGTGLFVAIDLGQGDAVPTAGRLGEQ